jgi:hypothetical protein
MKGFAAESKMSQGSRESSKTRRDLSPGISMSPDRNKDYQVALLNTAGVT